MDLRRFFLVSIQWLVGGTMDVPFDACNETFLSNNGRGSMSSGYIPIEAATCVFWSSNSWHILNTFVGLHTALRCPTLHQCNSSKTFSWRWMNGMLPVSKGIEYKQFCEIGTTRCCENKTSMKISACLPVSVYFNRNSTGCVEAHCYVNEPDVNNTLGTNMSSVNNRNETYRCANTSSAAGIPIWTICLIAILIASNICLTLGLVLLWRKVNLQRKTHDVTDPAQTQTFNDQALTQAVDDQEHTQAVDDQEHTQAVDDQDHTQAVDDQDHTQPVGDQDHTQPVDDQDHTHDKSRKTVKKRKFRII